MKVIFINAEKQEVEFREIENSLQAVYELLGVELIETAAYINENHALYVDEEGLLKNPRFWFSTEHCSQPHLAGNGVIIGLDPEEGNWVDCTLKLEDARIKNFAIPA